MPRVLRPVSHEDRLSVVDHLDELRSRMFVCVAALIVAFGLCFWQNQVLLNVLNKPLPESITSEANHLSGLTSDSVKASKEVAKTAKDFGSIAQQPSLSPQVRALFNKASSDLNDAA